MAERVTLPLQASDGEPLVHAFYRQPAAPQGLLLAFPGVRYGMDGPLLYYAALSLRDQGWDTLALQYGFQREVGDFDTGKIPGLLQECRQAILSLLGARSYPRVGLLGKSLGAGVAAYLAQAMPELSAARLVYLTPPLGTPLFDPNFVAAPQPAYVAIGTADRYYDETLLEGLRQRRSFELSEIDGVDHSLNAPGDIARSLAAVERVVREAGAFLTG